MLDVEPLILEELAQLSPFDEAESGDWDAILAHATPPRRRHKRLVRVVFALAVVIAIVLPAVAFSESVRNLLGVRDPSPRYDQAQVQAEAKLPEGLVARIWSAPSTQGGTCVFVTYDPTSSPAPPTRMSGGGFCARAGAQIVTRGHAFWAVATAPNGSNVLSGVVAPDLDVSRVTLRWTGGAQLIPSHNGYFVGPVPVVASPPFKLLPFDVVATDRDRRTVSKQRIPTSFLYRDWKTVEPKLSAYRQLHGCKKATWKCRSR